MRIVENFLITCVCLAIAISAGPLVLSLLIVATKAVAYVLGALLLLAPAFLLIATA